MAGADVNIVTVLSLPDDVLDLIMRYVDNATMGKSIPNVCKHWLNYCRRYVHCDTIISVDRFYIRHRIGHDYCMSQLDWMYEDSPASVDRTWENLCAFTTDRFATCRYEIDLTGPDPIYDCCTEKRSFGSVSWREICVDRILKDPCANVVKYSARRNGPSADSTCGIASLSPIFQHTVPIRALDIPLPWWGEAMVLPYMYNLMSLTITSVVNIENDKMLMLMHQCPNLEHLALFKNTCNSLTDGVCDAIRGLPLQCLELHSNQDVDISASVSRIITDSAISRLVLSIHGPPLVLRPAVLTMKNLQMLDVENDTHIFVWDMDKTAVAGLTQLRLSGCTIQYSISMNWYGVSYCTQLRYLDISRVYCLENRHVRDVLTRCNRLRLLNLSHNDAITLTALDRLSFCPDMEVVCINGCKCVLDCDLEQVVIPPSVILFGADISLLNWPAAYDIFKQTL